MSQAKNPVNWFELPVADLSRAESFYSSAFGVEFAPLEMGPAKMAMFPMEMDLPGAGGALVESDGYTPSHAGTVVYFPVADIDAALGKVGAAGGKTLVPKTDIGPYGHFAHFEDTEGNRVGLHTPAAG